YNVASTFDQYVQASSTLAQRFAISAGVRHGTLGVHSRDHYLANGDDSGARRFTFTNPAVRIGLLASDALTLHAAAGRGYDTPTLNELAYRADGSAGLNPALEAQKSRQYEIGARWHGGEHSLETTLFRADTGSEIVTLSNAGGRSTFQNAGPARRD